MKKLILATLIIGALCMSVIHASDQSQQSIANIPTPNQIETVDNNISSAALKNDVLKSKEISTVQVYTNPTQIDELQTESQIEAVRNEGTDTETTSVIEEVVDPVVTVVGYESRKVIIDNLTNYYCDLTYSDNTSESIKYNSVINENSQSSYTLYSSFCDNSVLGKSKDSVNTTNI